MEKILKEVGEVGSIPGTSGFTMVCFKADEVPVGTKVYVYVEMPKKKPVKPLKVTHDGEEPGEVRERCCMCRTHTNYWYTPKDVALCQECATKHTADELPSKQEWCAKERELERPRIGGHWGH